MFSKSTLRWLVLVCLLLLLLVGIVKILGSAAQFLLMAFLAAYLVLPLLNTLEKLRVPRMLSVVLLFLLISSLLVAIVFVVLPLVIEQLRELVVKIPEIITALTTKVQNVATLFGVEIPMSSLDLRGWIVEHLNDLFQRLGEPLMSWFKTLVTGSFSIFLWILNLALFPVFFFFVTLDYEKITQGLKSLVPAPWQPLLQKNLVRLNDVLAGFIRGQLIVCFVLATLYGLSFQILGVPFGLAIGIVGGLLSFIPYVGAGFAFLTAFVVKLSSGGTLPEMLLLVFVFGLIQSLESFVLSPRLVGSRVGLPPLLSILALICGANLLGFWGMIIAIPLAGFIRLLILDATRLYRASAFYRRPVL